MAGASGAASAPAAGDAMAVAVPMGTLVAVDETPCGRWILTNKLTFEKQILPEGPHWEVVCDDDGDATLLGVLAEGESVSLMLEDVLQQTVYESADGSRHMKKRADGTQAILDLSFEMSKFRRGQCTCLVHNTGAQFNNARCFWDIGELHTFMDEGARVGVGASQRRGASRPVCATHERGL